MQSVILFGGSDQGNRDYSYLRETAKSNKQIRWSSLKDVRAGDEIWFYITCPIKGIVAKGTAISDAKPGRSKKEWPYMVNVDKVEWLEPHITVHEIRNLFPEWGWAKSVRGKVHLSEKRAELIRKTIRRKIICRASSNNNKSIPHKNDELLREGTPIEVRLTKLERNPKARKACINHYGASCSICNIRFDVAYGEIGRGFIHVHHVKPIADATCQRQVDPLRDLVPVCPNCHAMLHAQTPPLTVRKLKSIFHQRV